MITAGALATKYWILQIYAFSKYEFAKYMHDATTQLDSAQVAAYINIMQKRRFRKCVNSLIFLVQNTLKRPKIHNIYTPKVNTN